MATKKEIEALVEKAGLHPESIGKSTKQPGTWILKRSFFYTHGYSAEKMADRLKATDARVTIISASDIWKSWPTESYFEVRFTVADAVPANTSNES